MSADENQTPMSIINKRDMYLIEKKQLSEDIETYRRKFDKYTSHGNVIGILLGVCIAVPVSYGIVDNLLQNYPKKLSYPIGIFASLLIIGLFAGMGQVAGKSLFYAKYSVSTQTEESQRGKNDKKLSNP